MTVLKSILALLLMLIGLALLPMRDMSVGIKMSSSPLYPLYVPWLLPAVRAIGGLSLVAGIWLAWKTYQKRRRQPCP